MKHLPPEKERIANAYHEAGHAVAASLLNYPFLFVTITPDEYSSGRLETKRTDEEWTSAAQAHAELIVSLAGFEAEKLFNPDADIFSRMQDEMLASMACGWLMGDSNGLNPRMVKARREARQAITRFFEMQAGNLVRQYRKSIKAVAKALLERDLLDDEDVWALIQIYDTHPRLSARA